MSKEKLNGSDESLNSKDSTIDKTAETEPKATEAATAKKTADTAKSKKDKAMKSYKGKKAKKVVKTIIIILIILGVLIFAAYRFGLFNRQNNSGENQLTTYTVTRRTITEIIEGTGTIGPNEEYNVTPLVSGEILEDYFEEGDNVLEDQALYLIDSESGDSRIRQLNNQVEKAENALKQAYDSLDDLYIESTITGTVEEIFVEVGDNIKQGEKIADVIDKNTMLIDVPFFDVDITSGLIKAGDSASVMLSEDKYVYGYVKNIAPTSNPNANGTAVRNITIAVTNSGSISNTTSAVSATVNDCTSNSGGIFEYNDSGSVYATNSGEIVSISVVEGSHISKGDYIITLSDENIKDSISDLENNVEDALIDLEDAEEELDNYKIKAPKTGKIVTKTFKKGDTVSGNGNGGTSLAVIYDMSALKFTMNIDELDIDKLDIGQEVIVTCDSREGEQYSGTITNISILGTTSNGTTTYPVEVTIENTEDESKRVVDENGTIYKTYKTGMTSTISSHSLVSVSQNEQGTTYSYDDGTSVLKTLTGDLYIGTALLRTYGDSYVTRDSYYTFSDDFSTLSIEVQNTKGMLRIAMNVDAKVVVERHVNVIAVPQTAVGRGDIVKVLKNTDASSTNDESKSESDSHTQTDSAENEARSEKTEGSKMQRPEGMPEGMPEGGKSSNMPERGNASGASESSDIPFESGGNQKSVYGTAPIDSEYEEVRVTTGASDDDYIEITSGLEEGDVVIIDTSNSDGTNAFMRMGMMGGGMQGGGMQGGMPSGNMRGGMSGGMSGGGMAR